MKLTLIVLAKHFQRAAKETVLPLNLFRVNFVAWSPVLIHIIFRISFEAIIGTFKIDVKLISVVDRHNELI